MRRGVLFVWRRGGGRGCDRGRKLGKGPVGQQCRTTPWGRYAGAAGLWMYACICSMHVHVASHYIIAVSVPEDGPRP